MTEKIEDDDDSAYTNRRQRRVIIGIIALTILTLGTVYVLICPEWYQNYAPKQPIPFSHKIHAGQYHIDCRYCHPQAEFARNADVPGLETCMNCHRVVKTDSPWIKQITAAYEANKPIQWVKVHVLPDFVHFNHHRHIAAGVECQTCHGPVQTMDRVYQYAGLNMGWCINCHRNNNYLTPFRVKWSERTKELKGETGKKQSVLEEALSHPDPHNASVACSTCHY